jgi:hypothetical protein
LSLAAVARHRTRFFAGGAGLAVRSINPRSPCSAGARESGQRAIGRILRARF